MLPLFFENSKIPKILSYISPIEINAINLGVFVFSRSSIDNVVKNHERIHYKQHIELLFVGFWILYLYYWIKGIIVYRDKKMAYYLIPFEQEAYENESNLQYLKNRKLYNWVIYRKSK